MASIHATHSLDVARYFDAYATAWIDQFPTCLKKGHWHILVSIRMSEDGVLFSKLRGRMGEIYGMDEDTCQGRLKELINAGLISIEDDSQKIRSGSCFLATEKLKRNFDDHCVKTAHDIYRALSKYTDRMRGPAIIPSGLELNILFFGTNGLFSVFSNTWISSLERFLANSIPKSKAIRAKAMQELLGFSHWHILMASWVHSHPNIESRKNYMLVDDFHYKIYNNLSVGIGATTSYVQEMVDWGFLERLGKNDGVTRNRFAVRITPQAFDVFDDVFASAIPMMADTAKGIDTLATAVSQPSSAVLSFPVVQVARETRENVSGTSSDDPSEVADKGRSAESV